MRTIAEIKCDIESVCYSVPSRLEQLNSLIDEAFKAGQAEGGKDKERLDYLESNYSFLTREDVHYSSMIFMWCSFRWPLRLGIDAAITQSTKPEISEGRDESSDFGGEG